MRAGWLVVVGVGVVTACKGKQEAPAELPRDARSDGGSAGRPPGTDAPVAPGPAPGVSPSGGANPGCATVGNAIAAWQRIQLIYDALLAQAIKAHWTSREYDDAVGKVYARETASAGATAGLDERAPTPSTNMCDCAVSGLPELCAYYARNGKPAVLCDAAKAHEAAHVAQCEANARRLAGNSDKWPCAPGAAGNSPVATLTPAQKHAGEHAAYDANLRLLGDWVTAERCTFDPVPHEACLLVSEADAATALGRDIESRRDEPLGSYASCSYVGAGSTARRPDERGVSMVTIQALQMRVSTQDFVTKTVPGNQAATGAAPTVIAGLGDAAVAFGDGDEHGVVVLAHQGEVVITIAVTMQNNPGRDLGAQARALAAIAVAHLPRR